jgi:hypothetical protein
MHRSWREKCMLVLHCGPQWNSFASLFLVEIRQAFACTDQENIDENSCGLRDFL